MIPIRHRRWKALVSRPKRGASPVLASVELAHRVRAHPAGSGLRSTALGHPVPAVRRQPCCAEAAHIVDPRIVTFVELAQCPFGGAAVADGVVRGRAVEMRCSGRAEHRAGGRGRTECDDRAGNRARAGVSAPLPLRMRYGRQRECVSGPGFRLKPALVRRLILTPGR
jgi:hypothetical protein